MFSHLIYFLKKIVNLCFLFSCSTSAPAEKRLKQINRFQNLDQRFPCRYCSIKKYVGLIVNFIVDRYISRVFFITESTL